MELLTREQLDELETWGTEVIMGRARGFRAGVMRGFLGFLSVLFRLGVKTRLTTYSQRIRHQVDFGVMVIAIGNITVGGTGKTPVVELFARTLRDRGRKVAILSRGYKSRELAEPQTLPGKLRGLSAEVLPKVVSVDGELLLSAEYAGDEPYMLAKNLDAVSVVVDRDRVKAAKFAIEHLVADTLILDDGMQYLNLAHALDVVLIDSQAPFGTGKLLPRGTLREPPSSLRRASYLFLTKCAEPASQALLTRIRNYNRTAELIECNHLPVHLENVFSGERESVEFLKGKFVACISGIARPESFENGIAQLGAKVEIRRQFNDHHAFNQKEIDQFMERCVNRDIELIVTTEKDAVRFPRPAELDVPIYFLRIEVRITRGERAWQSCIERIESRDKALLTHQW